jgi:acyl transferase domain-containing protein/NAD(P)H-dependent flavin oxidoreductase YrpB (nitropropane dioxygenase family)/NAD(P)-dependent dehydrogenase (short-subunit alcohol dehydrogenase family)
MDERLFQIIALTPAGVAGARLVVAADRAGCLGVLNAEIGSLPDATLETLRGRTRMPYGLKVASLDDRALTDLQRYRSAGLGWLLVDASFMFDRPELFRRMTASALHIMVEITEWDDRLATLSGHYALVVKGHEAGGLVGEETSFILLQKALQRQSAPVLVRGGVGLHGAAAVRAAGAAGVVLDDQLLLLKESPVALALRAPLRDFSGLETGLVQVGEQRWRVFEKPGFPHLRQIRKWLSASSAAEGREHLLASVGWDDPANQILLIGQAAAFARPFADRFSTFGRLAQAMRAESERRLPAAITLDPLGRRRGVATSHQTEFPIVQGPMTRVTDVAAFAQEVADAGGLPLVALALMQPEAVEELLRETAERLSGKSWGVGLLGFAPAELIREQVKVALRYAPRFALIAGGRPEQAKDLELSGITSYLHVPSPRLLTMFLEAGARRFVFEGRECGGHVGPLASLVLWDSMVSTLLSQPVNQARDAEIQVLFAGGIHDERSAAMVSVMAAPLVERGMKIGVLMGTAYLFTHEIVRSGAVVQEFQNAAIACEKTLTLETGLGHASRAVVTPFAEEFLARRRKWEAKNLSADTIRLELEKLSLGRLRLASKGQERGGPDGSVHAVPLGRQQQAGMYMIGQVATLRREVKSVADLHHSVSVGARKFLSTRNVNAVSRVAAQTSPARPADIAIIGVAGIFPKADSIPELWENILDKVDGTVEIPRERWDWRLYFNEDRTSPDSICSRWGGFLNDLLFDPLQYGIPPRAVKAVDPLQLMTLEVVRRCLADAGLENAPELRERTSVILGASGIGDVGAQYAVRAEMPRFIGALAPQAAARLPEWSEDSFAGILLNVTAGRAANRFDFGGVNYTIDAACASSLAAVYQAVLELETHRSDVVVTGGLDTVQGPFGYLCFSKTEALSPRGRCRAFDSTADGIVISEGIAVISLKRLADAERDGDRIYAVIKGVGGSSDGRARSMTAPHPDGQLRALSRAYDMAGYSPSSVGLFEAHGTGTVAGDTAELETLTRLLARNETGVHEHAIGSIKTFIGHTKAAAGIAGLINAALACYHKVLPPHADVEVPNSKLAESNSPLYLVKEAQPWLARANAPRRAGVSAFGFGGTNFHVTLEEYDQNLDTREASAARRRWSHELLIWRGPDRPSLISNVRRTADRLAHGAQPLLGDLAFTLAQKAPKSGLTAALVAGTDENLLDQINAFAAHLERSAAPLPSACFFNEAPLIGGGGKLALIFPGQGAQYVGMMRELAMLFPEMRATLEKADAALSGPMAEKNVPGGRLSRTIFARALYDTAARKSAMHQLTRTDIAQPALGAIEAGLLEVLKELGLRADMVAGHSYGELVALYAAGVMTLDQLLTVSEARGRFVIEGAAGRDLGTMAAVHAGREAVERAIKGMADVWIACHNAPSQIVLSGTKGGVAAAIEHLNRIGLSSEPIHVGAAFHSPIVSPAADPLTSLIRTLPLKPPQITVYSNQSANRYPDDVEDLCHLLAQQLPSPIQFVAEIERMYADGARVFLAVGPKSAQISMIREILRGKSHRVMSCDDGSGGLEGLLRSLAALSAEGAELELARLWSGRECRLLDETLAPAPRSPAPQPHMWLLNGGGARQFGTPPLPVVTVEEATEMRVRGSVKGVQTFMPAVPPLVSKPQTEAQLPGKLRGAVSRPVPANGRQLDEENKKMAADEPHGVREAALIQFQGTMQRFLEAQESVMLAYLTGERTRPNARPVLQPMKPTAPTTRVHRPLPGLPLEGQQRYTDSADTRKSGQTSEAITASAGSAGNAQQHSPVLAPAVEPLPRMNGTHLNGTQSSTLPSNPISNHAATTNTASLDRAALIDCLMSLVQDRTGYPRDVLGMDENLEADLGIDSIKRVEIIGALLKWLPAAVQTKTAGLGEALTAQKTLNGILDLLWSNIKAEAGGLQSPFDLTGADTHTVRACARPPRFRIVAHNEDLPRPMPALPLGTYVITDDGTGIAIALADLIAGAGGKSNIVSIRGEAPHGFQHHIKNLRVESVRGFIHLAPFGTHVVELSADPSAWRAAVECNELLPHQFVRHIASLKTGGRILLVSGLGGTFGRGASSGTELRIAGGGPALAKTLHEEWPGVVAKAIDLPRDRNPGELARLLFTELAVGGGRIEVGYPGGRRTIFRTEAAEIGVASVTPRDALPDGAVVLATGGARGITAEVLRPLVRPGITLVLVGRSPLPESEEPAFAELKTDAALRAHLIAQARATGAAIRPREIERLVQTLLHQREIRANIAEFRSAGADIVYKMADVRNAETATEAVRSVYDLYGRLDGVIHGAGVIEDKWIINKDAESWLRVVETKALSAFTIASALNPRTLRFFVMFGSVAGRCGNSGQSDYGVANELLNRLAWQLRALWPQTVKLAVLNWGPWAGTRYGRGMVSAEMEHKFTAKGIDLIGPDGGALACRDEILYGPTEDVEIVIGKGPWEQLELHQSAIRNSNATAETSSPSALLLDASSEIRS